MRKNTLPDSETRKLPSTTVDTTYVDDMANSNGPFRFKGTYARDAKRALQRYPSARKQSAVLPLLDLAQRQNTRTNCITPDAIAAIATMLGMPEIRVYEVATFYSMFRLHPTGKFHIQVCGTTPCMLCNAQAIKAAFLQALDINEGETTSDGLFTVSEVECLGACVNGPVVQINDTFCHNMTTEQALQIIDELKNRKTSALMLTMNTKALPLGEISEHTSSGSSHSIGSVE